MYTIFVVTLNCVFSKYKLFFKKQKKIITNLITKFSFTAVVKKLYNMNDSCSDTHTLKKIAIQHIK